MKMTEMTEMTEMTTNKKTEIVYNDRNWLNPTSSSFTGSIVSYLKLSVEKPDQTDQTDDSDGQRFWDDHVFVDGFVEIADCQTKVRIHTDYGKDQLESAINFREKLYTFSETIANQIDALDEIIEVLEAEKEETKQ